MIYIFGLRKLHDQNSDTRPARMVGVLHEAKSMVTMPFSLPYWDLNKDIEQVLSADDLPKVGDSLKSSLLAARFC